MTEPEPQGVAYSDTRVLLSAVNLTDVVVYELAAARSDSTGEENFSMAVQSRTEQNLFEVRAKIDVIGIGAQFMADCGAVFTVDPPGSVTEACAQEFSEKVGVMTVYPYIRAAIGQLASQMGAARPVLPLLRAGGVRLSPPDDHGGDDGNT